MNPWTLLMNGLWAALFATALGVLLTAPRRYLAPTFLCGLTGRVVRDLLMGVGLTQHWSTVVAAAVLVVVAAASVQRQNISPVVLICAVLPLGAAVAMFNVMFGLMTVSSLEGEALTAAVVALGANTGRALIGTLSIALGLAAGVGTLRLLKRAEVEGV